MHLPGISFAAAPKPMGGRKLLTALGVCVIALVAKSADACSCGTPGSACDAASGADAVFVGNVVSIESSPVGGRRVQLAVIEAFRGFQLSQVTLVTGYGQGDCGYPFQMGESYVVYAHRSPQGELSTYLCSRTHPVRNATEDLSYLRSLASIPTGTPARIAGRVLLWQLGPNTGDSVSNVNVTARGEGGTFSARTDSRGEFELTGLPAGNYEIVAQAPAGYESVSRTVDIHDPRGCGPTLLYLRYDGRVAGRVVDRNGAGVRGLPVELVLPADVDKPGGGSNRFQTWTSADGSFELRLVSPGEYVLGFNSIIGIDGRRTFPRALYPGVTEPAAAARINVSAAERVRLRDFVIPASIPLVTVQGIVVDEAGRPEKDATLALRDNTEAPNIIGPRFVTGEDGRFTFSVVDGGRYDIHVTRYAGTDPATREVQVAIVPFTASAATPFVTATIKPNRY